MRMKVSDKHTKVRVEMQSVGGCIKVTVRLCKLKGEGEDGHEGDGEEMLFSYKCGKHNLHLG
jgi:hypothetical protein